MIKRRSLLGSTLDISMSGFSKEVYASLNKTGKTLFSIDNYAQQLISKITQEKDT
jgi:hypothetical protein